MSNLERMEGAPSYGVVGKERQPAVGGEGSRAKYMRQLETLVMQQLGALGVPDLSTLASAIGDHRIEPSDARHVADALRRLSNLRNRGQLVDWESITPEHSIEMPRFLQSMYCMPSGDIAVGMRFTVNQRTVNDVHIVDPVTGQTKHAIGPQKEPYDLFGVTPDNQVLLRRKLTRTGGQYIAQWNPYTGKTIRRTGLQHFDSMRVFYDSGRNEMSMIRTTGSLNKEFTQVSVLNVATGRWKRAILPKNIRADDIDGMLPGGELIVSRIPDGGFHIVKLRGNQVEVSESRSFANMGNEPFVLPNGGIVFSDFMDVTGAKSYHGLRYWDGRNLISVDIELVGVWHNIVMVGGFDDTRPPTVLVSDYPDGAGRVRAVDFGAKKVVGEFAFPTGGGAKAFLSFDHCGRLVIGSGNTITTFTEKGGLP